MKIFEYEWKEIRKKISFKAGLCNGSQWKNSVLLYIVRKMKITFLLFLPHFEYLLKMLDSY